MAARPLKMKPTWLSPITIRGRLHWYASGGGAGSSDLLQHVQHQTSRSIQDHGLH